MESLIKCNRGSGITKYSLYKDITDNLIIKELIYIEESLRDSRIYLIKKIAQYFCLTIVSWFSERRFNSLINYAASNDKRCDHYEIL
jgi:hypothetical protein